MLTTLSCREGPPSSRARTRADAQPAALLELLEPRALLSGAVPDGGPTYTHFYYYPEGFAGSTISEFLPLGNPNSTSAQYRVIAHFEADLPDLVLASGTLFADTRGGITLSRAADHSHDLVDQGQPYALEVQSTGPLVAGLSHYDFGSAAGETFTDTPANSWAIPQVGTGEGRSDFVLWYNTADTDASITVRFVAEDGSTITTVTTTTRAAARGGLDLSLVEGLPASGTFAAVVTSDQPIVAAASRYFSLGDQHSASTELATSGSGATSGVMPLGSLAGNATEEIALFDPSEPPALLGVPTDLTATLTFRSDDDSIAPIQQTVVLTPGGVTHFDVGQLAAQLGDSRYSVEFTSTLPLVGRVLHHEHGDDASTSFSQSSRLRATFADGFMDPARAGQDLFETIGARLLPGATQLGVRVIARFTGGVSVSETFSFNANGVFSLDLHTWTRLVNSIRGARQYFYTIEVDTDSAAAVSMWHYDLTLGASTPTGGFGTGPQGQDVEPPAPPPPPAQGTAIYNINTAFALDDGTSVPLGGVLNVPLGGSGRIDLSVLAGVFNFDPHGMTVNGGQTATNQGILDLEGGITLVGDGVSLALADVPRIPPFVFGPDNFNGVLSPSHNSITGIAATDVLLTVPWLQGQSRPDAPALGIDALTSMYRFSINLADTATPRDVVVSFAGTGFAAGGWFSVSETAPTNATDGSVYYAGLGALPAVAAAPVSLTIHIGA